MRRTVNVPYHQVCFRIDAETRRRAEALIPRLAKLDALQRSVSLSDAFREALRRGIEELERTLPGRDT